MIRDIFDAWIAKPDFAKLQYTYAAVVLVSLVFAGLVGLLNQPTARAILAVSGIAATALVVNLVTYALINLLQSSSHQTPVPTVRKKKP